MELIRRLGIEQIFQREHRAAMACAHRLEKLGFRVFAGAHQAGTVSFLPKGDCEAVADFLAKRSIAVRAGLHCAPLAHDSAGTLETGTVRISFGHEASRYQVENLCRALATFSG